MSKTTLCYPSWQDHVNTIGRAQGWSDTPLTTR